MIISIGTTAKCSDVPGHNQGTQGVRQVPGHGVDIANFGRAISLSVFSTQIVISLGQSLFLIVH